MAVRAPFALYQTIRLPWHPGRRSGAPTISRLSAGTPIADRRRRFPNESVEFHSTHITILLPSMHEVRVAR